MKTQSENMENNIYDLVIIGAGPAGISLAVEAKAAGLAPDKIKIIEKAPKHSWMIRSLYPGKKIVTANYKGIASICQGVICFSDSSKEDTITFLDKAINNSGIKVQYQEEIRLINRLGDKENRLFELVGNKETYRSRIVAIAIGIFGKPARPDYKIPPELKTNVHFDITTFLSKNEKILVIGGGDTAGEYAQFLVQQGNDVDLSYRRNTFSRMNPINRKSTLALHERKRLNILWESNILELSQGEKHKICAHFQEDIYGQKEYDRIVYALGGSTPENFLKSAGIDFHGNTPKIDHNGESDIPGLFVTGDLAAGKKGGSISTAFNASRNTMKAICRNYLNCKVKAK